MRPPRSRARAWALQVLYAWETRGPNAGTPRQILAEFQRDRRIRPASQEYLVRLVGTVADHGEEIDAAVQGALTNWRLDRLSLVDRNILRLAAAELLHHDDVPPLVSIQEAILLAEKYGTEQSPRFVNGVLDALMKDLPEMAVRTGEDS